MSVLPKFEKIKIGIVGLGYVGLPLAIYMARHFPVVGFDVNEKRIAELSRGVDRTREVTAEEFRGAKGIRFSHSRDHLKACNFFIVTVPTPIDAARRPDFTALIRASETIGAVLKQGDIVVYESTVYPGATEEVCVPILERVSGLRFNQDFFAGYSPERINPGDQEHRLPSIMKVTSGSTPEAAELIDKVYAKVITAGTHRASSIRVAEAAKVIENIQRDVNIALVNELAMLFKKLGINTQEVLAASGTKWNFHRYAPGLVGGHCIGVDPYYLTHKAQEIGFHTEMILAGRRINDSMASYVAQDIVRTMLQRRRRVDEAKILVLGLTFKENCPDLRNTKVADLVKELKDLSADVAVFDPIADPAEAEHEYGLTLLSELPKQTFDVVVVAVKHDAVKAIAKDGLGFLLKPAGLIYDIKGVLPSDGAHAKI
jgi:UDP-N-acetyl-D-glucosamine/UDP-N-acetyl-D-galactosamine dehydrogenase